MTQELVITFEHAGRFYQTKVNTEDFSRLREPEVYEAVIKPALYRLGLLKHEAVKE